MISFVYFDFGGVLSQGGGGGSLENILQTHTGRPIEDFEPFMQAHRKFRTGKMTETDFLLAINTAYPGPVPLTKDTFLSQAELTRPVKKVYDLVAWLKRQNIGVGILSNMYPFSAQQLKESGLCGGFDQVIFSSDVGYAKPDTEIYMLAAKRAHVAPESMIFVDDLPKNMPNAQALGIKTVLSSDADEIVKEVKAIITTENHTTA